jgi:hypothetical protein
MENYKVENDGIFIPLDELIKQRKHYRDVQKNCGTFKGLERYYDGKASAFDDLINAVNNK